MRVIIAFLFTIGLFQRSALADGGSVTLANQSHSRMIELSPAALVQIDREIHKMPLRKKVGQLFMLGFQGQSMDAGLEKTIANLAPGGLIVFGRNMSSARQVSELLAQAQRKSLHASGEPLLIATDQEGGDVIRVQTSVPLPSALAIGQAGQDTIARDAGAATGHLLKTLGFNMDLAPVLDVSDEKQAMFIGTRTYGANPVTVGRMGTLFAEGLIEARVLPTGKHFPGHGGIVEDSHVQQPSKAQTLEEMRAFDLVPFRMLQDKFPNLWATMVAHVAYPQIDTSGAPASLSKILMERLLRTELKFNGLVLTDDINMAGLSQAGESGSNGDGRVREHTLRALEAGADMIVVAWNQKLQKSLVDTVLKAVHSKRLLVSRINQSLKRILIAKRLFAAPAASPASAQQIQMAMQNPLFLKVGDATIAAHFALTPVAAEAEFVDWAHDRPVVVFSANETFSRTFKAALGRRSVRNFRLDINRPFDISKVLLANPTAVGVFYVSGNQAAHVASQVPEDIARRILLVTVEASATMPNAASFRHIAAVYYRHPKLGRLVAERYFHDSPDVNDQVRRPASDLVKHHSPHE